ncbi:class I SAM-dependent methyltransferase [Streptomyces sp. NPDC058417]|uniref:class I SAM-dependent methyltransferase n=1 Tax=unclassified Streptomyces TaxID=2593676 RepID=UPI003648E98A
MTRAVHLSTPVDGGTARTSQSSTVPSSRALGVPCPAPQAVADQEPWWITNYRGRGPHQRYSHHNHAETRRSIGFFIHHLGLRPRQAILDLCCAFGRHTHEFTLRGLHRTVGVDDLSPDMLAHAASSAGADGQRPRFVRADVRALPS